MQKRDFCNIYWIGQTGFHPLCLEEQKRFGQRILQDPEDFLSTNVRETEGLFLATRGVLETKMFFIANFGGVKGMLTTYFRRIRKHFCN